MFIKCTHGIYNAEKFIGFRLVSVDKSDEPNREVSSEAEGYAIVGILPLYSESGFSCDTESYVPLEFYKGVSDAKAIFKELTNVWVSGTLSVVDLSLS